MYILSCFTVLKVVEDSPFGHSNCNWKKLLILKKKKKAVVVNNVTQFLISESLVKLAFVLCLRLYCALIFSPGYK